MELEGQVAIVTGAGRGIGRATALELARLGANLVDTAMQNVPTHCGANPGRGARID